MLIYDPDGNELGDLPISEGQQAMLDDGHKITVQYHTPQLLVSVLGRRNGAFELRKQGNRVIALAPPIVKEFLEFFAAVKTAQEKR